MAYQVRALLASLRFVPNQNFHLLYDEMLEARGAYGMDYCSCTHDILVHYTSYTNDLYDKQLVHSVWCL